MPTLARYMIRSAFLWLSAAFLTAALMLSDQALRLGLGLGVLQPVFYHLLMVGALLQLIFGVAIWLFPVHTKERPRGDERLAWAGYALLNLGLPLRVAGEPLLALAGAGALPATLLVLSALLQLLAVVLLIALIWPRVKERVRPATRAGAKEARDAGA